MKIKEKQSEGISPNKNPWWVKASTHVILICMLLRLLIDQTDFFGVMVIIFWIWIGMNISRNKIIFQPSGLIIFVLLFEAYLSYPTLKQIFHWLSSVWG